GRHPDPLAAGRRDPERVRRRASAAGRGRRGRRDRARRGPRRHPRMKLEGQRFVWLFAGLLVLLAGAPVVDELMGRPVLVVRQLASVVLLVLGVFSLSRAWQRVGVAILLVNVATAVAVVIAPGRAT